MKTTVDRFELKQTLELWSHEKYGINIFDHCRKKEYIYAKHNVIFALKKLTRFSLDNIGLICGNGKPLHHATVYLAVNIVANEILIYEDRLNDVNEVIAEINLILNPDPIRASDDVMALFKRIKENLRMSIMEAVTLNYIMSKFK